MEVLQLSGYTERESSLLPGYFVPRQIRENGLREGEVTFEEEALARIARDYTREAGCANLSV